MVNPADLAVLLAAFICCDPCAPGCPNHCNTEICPIDCTDDECPYFCDPRLCRLNTCLEACGGVPCQCEPCGCDSMCCDDPCCGDPDCPYDDDPFDHSAVGNIHLQVPILKRIAARDAGLRLHFEYNSIHHIRDSGYGYGWTHNHNLYAEEMPLDGGIGLQVVVYDSSGRRNAYLRLPDGSFVTPPGRQGTLEWVQDHYELNFWSGNRWVFSPTAGAGGRFYVEQVLSREGRQTSLEYNGLGGRLSRITDPWGAVVALGYVQDGSNLTLTITHPDSAQTTIVYEDDLLTSVTDPEGHVRSFQYDELADRISKDTRKNGTWFTFVFDFGLRETWDSAGNLVRRITAANFPDTFGHGFDPGPGMIVDGDGRTWPFERDAKGRIISQSTPLVEDLPALTVYGPDGTPDADYVVQRIDPLGFSESFEHDAYGNLTREFDKEGNQTVREFNDPNWPKALTRLIEPDQDEWAYTYDPLKGHRLTVTDPQIEAPSDRIVTFAYSYFDEDQVPGRLALRTVTDRNGHSALVQYDEQGQMIRTVLDPGGLDLVVEFSEHDAMGRAGRMIEHRAPGDAVVTTFEYDAMGRRTRAIVDPQGLELTTVYAYDGSGHLLSVSNPRQVVTQYEYDERNRLTRRFEDFGGVDQAVTEFEYDHRNNLTLQRDANDRVTTFEYNDRSQLVLSIDAEGYRTVYEPDARGDLLAVRRHLEPGEGGPQQALAFANDALGRRISRTAAPGELDLVSLTEYTHAGDSAQLDPATPGSPLPHKITDPRGGVLYLHYDARDRIIKSVRKHGDTADNGGDADDAVLTFEYDAMGNRTAVVNPAGERQEWAYDAADRVTQRTVDPGHFNIQTAFEYDGTDNLASAILPNGQEVAFGYDSANRLATASDALGLIVDYEYDAGGNVTRRSDALADHVWQFAFDRLDRLTQVYDPVIEQPDDRFTLYDYDAVGNRTMRVNRNGVKTRYVHDDLDRLTSTIADFLGSDPATANHTTSYTYDGAGGLRTLADHDGNTTTYTYDPAGRVTHVAYPDNDAGAAGEVTLGYDAAGNLSSRLDQQGILATYVINDLGRMTQRLYSTGRSETFEYDRVGRLVSAVNTVATRSFEYDTAGRLCSSHLAIAGYTPALLTTTYDYVISPAVTERRITYPGGRVVSESFDARLRLVGVATAGSGPLAEWTYDGVNRRESAALANGIASTFEYDLNDRLTRIQHARDAEDLVHVAYGWDPMNPSFRRDQVDGDRSELYTHDALDRLVGFARGSLNAEGTAITLPTAAPYLMQSRDWTLDRRGNWATTTSVQDGLPLTETRLSNSVNEITQQIAGGNPPVGPTYDNTGSLLSDGQRDCAYDEERRLISVVQSGSSAPLLDVAYDALGHRVSSRTLGTEVRVHVHGAGDTLLEEYDQAGVLQRQFIYGADAREPVAMIDRTAAGVQPPGADEVFFYLQDLRRSVVALTDEQGDIVERYAYEPYGSTHITLPGVSEPLLESTVGNPLMWTAQRYDAAARLYHFHFRSYSPDHGRWLQRDPIGYAGGSVSLYEYVGSSAIGSYDPLGLSPDNSVDQGGGGGGSGGGGGGGSPGGGTVGNPDDGDHGDDGGEDGDDDDDGSEGDEDGEEGEPQSVAQQLEDAIAAIETMIQEEQDNGLGANIGLINELINLKAKLGIMRRLVGDNANPDDAGGSAAYDRIEELQRALRRIHSGAGVALIVGDVVIAIGGVAIGIFIPGPDELLVIGSMMKAVRGARLGTVPLKVLKRYCFVAGTLVVLADGTPVPIEQIAVGDAVQCAPDPEHDAAAASCVVTRQIRRTTRAVVDLVIVSADGTLDRVTTTAEHPIYVPGLGRYVPALEVQRTPEIQWSDGSAAFVRSVTYRHETVPVYNLEVDSAHNYFVHLPAAATRLLVHNGDCGKVSYRQFMRRGAGGAARGAPKYGSTPKGRPFTKHYGTETGPKRNIPGSVVDDTIRKAPGKPAGGGKTVHYDPENNVTVVTGDGGSIVSAHKGPPRAGQR